MEEKNFNEAMDKILDIVLENYGSEFPLIDTIYGWFAINSKTTEISFRYDDDGMFYFLRDAMNYDLFWVTDEGLVDVENANDTEISALIAPFVKSDIALKVRDTF